MPVPANVVMMPAPDNENNFTVLNVLDVVKYKLIPRLSPNTPHTLQMEHEVAAIPLPFTEFAAPLPATEVIMPPLSLLMR